MRLIQSCNRQRKDDEDWKKGRVVCRVVRPRGWRVVALISFFLFPSLSAVVTAQTELTKTVATKAKLAGRTPAKGKTKGPANELAKLREDFIKANNDYKASLEKLRASYEKGVARAEAELAKSKELFAAGLISKQELATAEAEVTEAKGKVAEVDSRMTAADSQIAETLLEARVETRLARSPIPRGGLISTTALIRYNGGAFWALSEAWKVQQFFQNSFKRP